MGNPDDIEEAIREAQQQANAAKRVRYVWLRRGSMVVTIAMPARPKNYVQIKPRS